MSGNPKRKINIAFNEIGGDLWTGGITYINNLKKSLRKYFPDTELYIITQNSNKYINDDYDGIISFNTTSSRFFGIVNRIFRSRFNYDRNLKSSVKSFNKKIDIIFPSEYSTGKSPQSILWIPDFQILRLPEFFNKKEITEYKKHIIKSIKKSPLIVLSSHDAQNDFKEFYPDFAEKTRIMQFVAHVPESIYDKNPNETLKRYNIPSKFIYMPNQFWAHKNHLLVLEALKILKGKGIEPFFVLTGNPTDYRNPKHIIDILDKINKYGLRDQIALLGFVDHSDVYSLIRQSVCVCNPSLFEGWSTPVEEVKSVGKSILLSDLPVHLEQSPPGAIYFDRFSKEDLSEKLSEIWLNKSAGPDLKMEKKARELLPTRMEVFGKNFLSILSEIVD